MKSHKKLLSLVTAVLFCVTFLAPVLVAPAPAMAASTFSAAKSENISTVNTNLTKPIIRMDIADTSVVSGGEYVTFHMPSELSFFDSNSNLIGDVYYSLSNYVYKFNTTTQTVYCINTEGNHNPSLSDDRIASEYPGVMIDVPMTLDATTVNRLYSDDTSATTALTNAKKYFIAYRVGTGAFEIKMLSAGASALIGANTNAWTKLAGAGRVNARVSGMRLLSTPANADLTCQMASPDGTGFSSGSVTFAKYISAGGSTTTIVKSVKKIGSSASSVDSIMVQENLAACISGATVKLKLPSGFKWVYSGTAAIPTSNSTGMTVNTSWGFGSRDLLQNGNVTFIDADRTMQVVITPGTIPDPTTQGRLYISDAAIVVDDENVAKKGDVTLNLTSTDTDFTTVDVILATYADYAVEVKEGTAKEVVAGQFDTQLGDFTIKEGLKGSMLANRKISLTLPTGVKWDTVTTNGAINTLIDEKAIAGAVATLTDPTSLDSSGRVYNYTVAATTTTATEIQFKTPKVYISPDFTGDLVIEVGGTAGITGKAKVATVLAPVAMTVENAPNIIIGAQAQKVGTILLKEGKKEVFGGTGAAAAKVIRLQLPSTGSKWVDKGTITVSEGDAAIDKVTLDADKMNILIKSTSTKPATIKIEGATVTPDRTVPEGDFTASLKCGDATTAVDGVVDSRVAAKFDITTVGKVAIAKVVTPAPTDTVATGANGAFTINSNVMMVNGQYRILDAAPYIKSGRTYVPIRAMGDALAATTNWDAATQTVTITKGDKTVALVIGNTVAKVNGADVTMEVAPEINNGRTMLPARYVAEGLGFQVQWNAATQQVVFGL